MLFQPWFSELHVSEHPSYSDDCSCQYVLLVETLVIESGFKNSRLPCGANYECSTVVMLKRN